MHEMQYCSTYAWNTTVPIKSFKKKMERLNVFSLNVSSLFTSAKLLHFQEDLENYSLWRQIKSISFNGFIVCKELQSSIQYTINM